MCHCEGFLDVEFKYLGCLWVLFEFSSHEAKDKFQKHKGILSCFSSLIPWHDDFVVNERLIWLEIKGVSLRAWDNDVFAKICNKWGEVLFLDDSDKCNRLSKRVCIKSSHALLVFATIMVTLNNVTYVIRVRELCSWTPNFVEENSLNEEMDSLVNYEGEGNSSKDENEVESVAEILLVKSELHPTDKDDLPKQHETMKSVDQQAPLDSDPFDLEPLIQQRCGIGGDVNHSVTPDFPSGFSPNNKGNSHTIVSSHKNKAGSSNVQVGFSMIERLEETIKVRLALGLNMEGCETTLASLIADNRDVNELCNKHRVNFLALQETKLLYVDLWKIRQIWGNTHFDFASISARGLSRGTRLMWIVVYAPQNLSCKISLWSSLATHIANWNGSLVIMGDFNEVRLAEERFGLVFSHRQSGIFNEFISNSSLIDIPLGGYNFTWTNKLGTKMSKLDRFLISESFHEVFPHVTGIVLEKGALDHRPIILKELEHLKLVIREWIKSKKAESNKIKREHQLRLSSIDPKVDQGNVSESDLLLRRDSIKILGDINRLDAKDMAQKSKVKWAIEGDENTSFFYGMLKKKRRKRFQRSHGIPPSLGGDMPNRLSSTQSDFLKHQISRDEIKKVMWDCGGDRAPGPDGFTFKFITTFWDLIEDDIIRFKVSNAKFVFDFRPISLIGCQYKIIGKILVNRLSKVIGSVISPEQSAFIKGRNILDGPLILNEVMAWIRKRKQALMVFKVDFEKAFDSLRGLRQGDPLSPFLFILAIEGLHVLTCKAMTMGIFKGVSIGNDNLSISHLIYANDVIFLGLKINVNKCNILGIGVSDDEVSNMANVIGCEPAKFPLKYLGVPVGCNMTRCSKWNDILQKFASKLSPWKARMLSGLGRLSLIKSVLANKDLGGLGIGSIYGLNLGLLFKWVWRFLCNLSDLWVRVVKILHGVNGGIIEDPNNNSCYNPWSGILSSISHLKSKGIDLLSLCVRKIGNGAPCRFWNDIWYGNQSFNLRFPRIYQLELVKDCSIADRIGTSIWNVVFRRPPRGGAEMSQLNDLLSLIQGVVLSDSSASWLWTADASRGYTVASGRTLIDSTILDTASKATRWN
ncbi:RNA-directed DNA polymerase, eukaryota [Tanacetum coccineum]